ncbi:MAG: DUF502 domain-containing protein, partial [Merismopedia sp. SIO2A8]|nr:DUF502 domain-containing protein [Merismopedia sp. SIO2A8]
IPLAGSVYKTLKQILETILGDSNSKFSRVVLVEYPRRGIWAMAFVTGTISATLSPKMSEPMLSVIIPTTPNPTSGWYAIVPEADVVNLSIPIEDAFKVLISGGIVSTNLLSSPDVSQDAYGATHQSDTGDTGSYLGDEVTAAPLDLPDLKSGQLIQERSPNSQSDLLGRTQPDLGQSGMTGGA